MAEQVRCHHVRLRLPREGREIAGISGSHEATATWFTLHVLESMEGFEGKCDGKKQIRMIVVPPPETWDCSK